MLNMKKRVKLQLVGLDGNAFNLLGQFKRAAKSQGWSKDEIQEVVDECTSGDYDHLLATLMEVCEDPSSVEDDLDDDEDDDLDDDEDDEDDDDIDNDDEEDEE